MEREQQWKEAIYIYISIYQIISKESGSNDKQVTKQGRCRWHEPYGNFIENRYRRRGISERPNQIFENIGGCPGGKHRGRRPSQKIFCCFCSLDKPRGGYTWPKKNLFSKQIVAGPNPIFNPRSNPIPILTSSFFFLFFLLLRSKMFEEIIFTKKKKLLLNRNQVKNNYERGVKKKFPSRGMMLY